MSGWSVRLNGSLPTSSSISSFVRYCAPVQRHLLACQRVRPIWRTASLTLCCSELTLMLAECSAWYRDDISACILAHECMQNIGLFERGKWRGHAMLMRQRQDYDVGRIHLQEVKQVPIHLCIGKLREDAAICLHVQESDTNLPPGASAFENCAKPRCCVTACREPKAQSGRLLC